MLRLFDHINLGKYTIVPQIDWMQSDSKQHVVDEIKKVIYVVSLIDFSVFFVIND